jgi:hypothetical protein
MVGTSSSQSIPGTVVAACVLWIIYGALGLLGGLTTVGSGASVAYGQIIFALAFIITGIQVLMGKASGLLGSGIACLFLAGLGALGAWFAQAAAEYARGSVASWVYVVIVINSGVLATAGILAIVGNAKYKAWRASR